MRMETEKRTLGRGLSSLLPNEPEVAIDSKDFAHIDVNEIEPNPYQPRQKISLESIIELSDSIKEKGVIQPLTVVKNKNDSGYLLVAGERRFQAAKLAGLKHIPCVIKEMEPQEMAEMAIVENIHRKDLNAIEEGFAYLRLHSDFNMSYEVIASKIAKTSSYIENKVRLTRLPSIVRNAVIAGEISELHGRAILGLEEEEVMINALRDIIKNNIPANRVEDYIRQLKIEKSHTSNEGRMIKNNPRIEWERKYNYIKHDFNDKLGMDVQLKRNKKNGGAILINFTNDDELVSIHRKLTGEESN